MRTPFRKAALWSAALFLGAAVLCINDNTGSLSAGAFTAQAEARVGRPMTPMSYAGVARRTTRRTVAVGAAAAAGTVGACQQVVDVYGRIVTQCY